MLEFNGFSLNLLNLCFLADKSKFEFLLKFSSKLYKIPNSLNKLGEKAIKYKELGKNSINLNNPNSFSGFGAVLRSCLFQVHFTGSSKAIGIVCKNTLIGS